MLRLALTFAVLAASMPAAAQVYKCKDTNGTTVFSSQPCGADARAVDVRPAAGRGASATPTQPSAPATSAPTAPAASPRSLVERGNAAAQRRMLDDEILRKERQLSATHAEHEERQAELREKKQRARNNLAGATWEQSISDEMNALASQYNGRIQQAQRDIDVLRQRRAAVPAD